MASVLDFRTECWQFEAWGLFLAKKPIVNKKKGPLILQSCMLRSIFVFNVHSELCGFRKYPWPSPRRVLEILGGGVFINTKTFKGKYEAKLGFPERCRGSNQKPFVGGVWIFSGTMRYHARDWPEMFRGF